MRRPGPPRQAYHTVRDYADAPRLTLSAPRLAPHPILRAPPVDIHAPPVSSWDQSISIRSLCQGPKDVPVLTHDRLGKRHLAFEIRRIRREPITPIRGLGEVQDVPL